MLWIVFKTHKNFYLYDRSKNKICEIKEATYNYLNGFDGSNTVKREIRKLRSAGYLRENNPLEVISNPYNDIVEHMLNNCMEDLILQVTQSCNLRCEYCIYSENNASRHGRQHRDAVMSYDKAVQIINFFMEHSRNKVIIGFYGGEPLLAFDLIKKIVQYIHSTFPERKVEYSITTNGTLLNNEIIEFFIREKFQMTLSIDGPKEIHDKNRHFQSGRGSFDVIVQKLTKLEQTFPKFLENVTTNTVINPEYNVNNYIDFFNDNVSLKNMHHRLSGLSDAGIDDIYVYNEDLKIAMAKEEIYAMANMLGWFAKDFELKEYFPPYMSDLIQKHAILESGVFISKSGHPGGPCIPGVKRCLVNIDGDIFPCEKAIENQEMVIGNTEQGFYLEKVKQFMNIGTLTENECKNCWAFLLCSSCGVSCTGSDGFCAKKRLKKCGGIQQYVIKILRSIKILEENGYDFYRFEKNVEE